MAARPPCKSAKVEAVIGWQKGTRGTAGTLACCEAKSGRWDRMAGWFCRVGDGRDVVPTLPGGHHAAAEPLTANR